MYDMRIINGKVYQNGEFVSTNLYVKDSVFTKITTEKLPSEQTIDAKGNLVIPGLIDPHVHFSLDLGQYTSRDDFYHGSKAALYGGITTIIDFLDPTSNSESLKQAYHKRRKQADKCLTDYKFHATLKNPQQPIDNYLKTMKAYHLDTLKLFTTYSESNRKTDDAIIKQLLIKQRDHDFLILGHVEDDEQIVLNPTYTFKDLNQSRPVNSEIDKALSIAKMVQKTGGTFYMVHTSSGETIKRLKQAYPSLLNTQFYIESCPQYFTFNEDDLNQPSGYLYTCAPPIRHHSHQVLLKKHFNDITTIGTDHCAFMKSDKYDKRLIDMPLGIGSIEQSFDVMYHFFGKSVIPKMSENVANIMNIPNKGKIQEGYDADCFIYNLGPRKISTFHNNTDYNLYEGLNVSGKVITTIAGGKVVMDQGKLYERKGRCLNETTQSNH